MSAHKRMRPPRQAAPGNALASGNSGLDYTLRAAAVHALDRELSIIISAVDQTARGYGLSATDNDRLHQAHQFLIRILADLRGVEVWT